MASLYTWFVLCLLLFAPSSLAEEASEVVVVTDATSSVLKEGEWMIEFYAPWCPACQGFESTWERFAETCKKKYPSVRVAKVDVTQETILSGRFLIQRLPTIFHAKDNEFRMFDSDRSASSLERFIAEQRWMEIDPYPWYTSPMGPISAVLGYSMLAGNELQRVYKYFTEELNLPVWLVIVIGVVTVVTSGVLIGLTVVFITLRFSPPVRVQATQRPPSPDNFGSTGEGDEPDKRKSSSDNADADEGTEEVDIDKSPPPSPKGEGSPDSSPQPSKSSDEQSPKPSGQASPGRQTVRKRKGKKMKASAD